MHEYVLIVLLTWTVGSKGHTPTVTMHDFHTQAACVAAADALLKRELRHSERIEATCVDNDPNRTK